MLFNSVEYLFLFFPCILLLCVLTRKLIGPRPAQLVILCASLYFYGQARPSNLIYLFISILVNWILGRQIEKTEKPVRLRLLRLGLGFNVVYLCAFRYTQFIADNLPFLRGSAPAHLTLIPVLGISFFTFTQIMYLVDCYEGLQQANSLFDHATFVSFFPYVISGPLAKAKRTIAQFGNLGGWSDTAAEMRARGLFLFAIGLFKKVVIADSLAVPINSGWATALHHSALDAWLLAFGYTLQIYFDFSGYTDMAMGSAAMLGVEIPRNFDAPLKSKSIIEFWQRWHISLTNFITTYMYTPILKSFRRATLATSAVATFIAMTVAGLWHGPAWTYVVFGSLHGVALSVNQYWRKKKMPKPPKAVGWAMTFAFVSLALVFFRAPDTHSALTLVRALVDYHHPLATPVLVEARYAMRPIGAIYVLPIVLSIVLAFFGKSSDQLAREFEPKMINWATATVAMTIALFYMNINAAQTFVYFQF